MAAKRTKDRLGAALRTAKSGKRHEERRGRPPTGNIPVMFRLNPVTAAALRSRAKEEEREISVVADRIFREALGLGVPKAPEPPAEGVQDE